MSSSKKSEYDLICVGGGAAGYFTALQRAEQSASTPSILILEKSNQVLGKVKVSGGGRCNVTHACFDPREMVSFYPRGHKELLGPFHQFLCGDMMGWLDDHGIPTHIEEDGRIFPTSNNSQTIIDCFQDQVRLHGINVKTSEGLQSLKRDGNGWIIKTNKGTYRTLNVMMATGSSPKVWGYLETLGLPIIPPVPSLFTFNIQHALIDGLPGLSVPNATVRIVDTAYEESGPLLITHWGLSGPAVLKLSSRAARELHAKNYHFKISVSWVEQDSDQVKEELTLLRKSSGGSLVIKNPLLGLPKRLWEKMCHRAGIGPEKYGDLNAKKLDALQSLLTDCTFIVNGKSTFKEEFVTAGGIDTKAINFKTMEAKAFPGLYFAGEVLNIDALTGGFNFQAAWTESYIAAKAMRASSEDQKTGTSYKKVT